MCVCVCVACVYTGMSSSARAGLPFGSGHRVLFVGDFLCASSSDANILAALDGMDNVEDVMELQADEAAIPLIPSQTFSIPLKGVTEGALTFENFCQVEADDVLANLYNFMPGLGYRVWVSGFRV